MILDLLWQNSFALALGALAKSAPDWLKKRVRHRRLRSFFGAAATRRAAVAVAIPIMNPLTPEYFVGGRKVERTTVLKPSRLGKDERWPVYGRVLHLDDYDASEEVFGLLRDNGAREPVRVPDYEAVGEWRNQPIVVCLGSPFVNAALDELLGLDTEGPRITAHRMTETLESYLVELREPSPLTLGVDHERAIGVIARLPNPETGDGAAVAIWGCRSESTLAAARYLHANFEQVAKWSEPGKPLIVLLAIRGRTWEQVTPMYVATDNTVKIEEPDLVRLYVRSTEGA